MLRRIFWPFLLLLVLPAPLRAAVDLVTLPTREGTQLTIYNSEDITMVREHRLLTVKEGVNRIPSPGPTRSSTRPASSSASSANSNRQLTPERNGPSNGTSGVRIQQVIR